MKTIIYLKDEYANKVNTREYKEHYPVVNNNKTTLLLRNNNTNLNDESFPLHYISNIVFDPQM